MTIAVQNVHMFGEQKAGNLGIENFPLLKMADHFFP